MRKKGTMLLLIFLLVFQNLFFGMVGFADQGEFMDQPDQDETVIEHPGEGEGDSGLEDDESVIDPDDGESTVTDEVYRARILQSGQLPVQLTDVEVSYFDDTGKENPIPITETSRRLELGETVRIEYQWELPEDHEGIPGDTFEFTIPEEFEIFSEITGNLVFGEETVGFFTVDTDNIVTMTFGDILNERSVIAGSLWFMSEIREDLHNIPTETEIRFPLTDRIKPIPVKFKPKGGSLIAKEGEAYPQAYDGTRIDWTIDVNTVLNLVEGATVYDEIPEGLELELDTVEVYKLNVDVSGNPIGDPESFSPEENRSNLSALDITLGDIDSAYRITFSTTVTVDWVGKKSFENTAELHTHSSQVVDTSTDTVILEKSPPLSKIAKNYDRATQTIEWEIQYNYNKREIAQENAVITDKLDSEEFVPNGIEWGQPEVYEVELDATGREIPGSAIPVNENQYTIEWTPSESSKAGFVIRFNNDISTPHKIVYTTQITGQVLNDTEVINNVKIGLEGDSIEWIAPVRQGIQQGILRKYLRGTDYNAKTNNWEIIINENGYDLEDLVVTDTLSGNLKYVEDSINVVGIADTAYIFTPTETGFILTFTETVSTKLTITYKTKFERAKDLEHGAFHNKVSIDWEGKYRETNPVPFNPNELTQKNGFKNGTYDAQTKKITWNIGVNYNLNEFDLLIVEDPIEEGQVLVEESVEVFEMNIATNGSPTKGDEVEEGFNVIFGNEEDDENNAPGFRIEFIEPTAKAYWITFQTNLDEQLISEWYYNTATLKDGSVTFAVLDNRVKVEHGDEYVFKKGVQQGRGIDWQIWINRNQSTIKAGARIIDTPGGSQVLLEDTFKLYGTTVSTGGTVTKDENNLLVEGEEGDYKLDFKDDGSFEIEFLKDMREAYVLEYTSFFTGTDGDTVTNKVAFVGEGSRLIEKETTESFRVRLSTGGGDIIGKTSRLTLIKVDAVDSDKKLAGAKFELYLRKSTGLVLIDTQTSNQNGEVTFENLLLREYILKEIEAPANYQLDETEIPIDLTSGSITDLPITNLHKDSPISKLGDYVWYDSNRNGIQDEPKENGVNRVKVELYKAEGADFGDTPYKITETADDKDGKPGYYLFDQLPPGQYKVCFKLPEGYKFTTPFAAEEAYPDKDSDAIPSEADPTIGCSEVINLGLNQFIDTIDAGLVLGRLGDYVWLDSNRNGIQDEPDSRGFNGVKVELHKKNDDTDEFEKWAETVTANDENGKPGYYLFDDLFPGEYKVKFELPRGFGFTQKEARNGIDGEISKANLNGWTDVITLEAGEEDLTIDAGLVVVFGSGGDDDGDNGGSNPPPTSPPGKENPKDNDPKDTDPQDPNKGTPGDHTDGDGELPASPSAPGSDPGDTSGGTEGDDGEKANNPPIQGETAPKDKGRTLPQTGENPSLFPILGLFFCLAGFILWYMRKPKLS